MMEKEGIDGLDIPRRMMLLEIPLRRPYVRERTKTEVSRQKQVRRGARVRITQPTIRLRRLPSRGTMIRPPGNIHPGIRKLLENI